MILQTTCNTSCCQCNLSGNEGLTTALRLMIEENAVYCEHTVCFSVLFYNPEAILFCHCVGAVGMERGCLTLRNFLYLSEKLGSRCLIDSGFLGQAADLHCFQNTKHAQCVHISGILRCVKTYLYMALCCQVVDLVRLYLADDTDDTG